MRGRLKPAALVLTICALAWAFACDGSGRGDAANSPEAVRGLRHDAIGLEPPAYHAPLSQWRARHGAMVARDGQAPLAGFELGECLFCHTANWCDQCHAHAGARALPGDGK
ncbi:hypothetical protein AAU61_10685 [Desulfocarbo indianensis]|nr:hypothetical protein AAU61_10685 [Desulfocarbo indianensis]